MTTAIVQAKKVVKGQLKETEEGLDAVKNFVIRSRKDNEVAGEILQEIKEDWKDIDAQRKRITVPLVNAQREVNALFKPVLETLAQAERFMKKKISDYQDEVEKKNRKLVEEAKAAEGEEEAQDALDRIKNVNTPRGVSIRKRWVAKVINAGLVPYEYCTPDMDLINAELTRYIKDTGEPPYIAGVKFEEEAIVASRSRKKG